MLIVALVLAVIGLAALVTAVVTSNELIAWVCIGASMIGVLLLVVDAVRERSSSRGLGESDDEDASVRSAGAEDYPELPEKTSAEQPESDDGPEATSHEPSDDDGAGKAGATDATKPE